MTAKTSDKAKDIHMSTENMLKKRLRRWYSTAERL